MAGDGGSWMVILDSLLGLADMPVGLRDCPLVGNAEWSLAAAEGMDAPLDWDCKLCYPLNKHQLHMHG
ncbi:MAG: hypothetical protein FRX49_11834 [Trebouxia sp. A1-2]|nr:MAG: hypothetical protein FRX49_11834 [Trebouxia sp. A1-2]